MGHMGQNSSQAAHKETAHSQSNTYLLWFDVHNIPKYIENTWFIFYLASEHSFLDAVPIQDN